MLQIAKGEPRLAQVDPELAEILDSERERQRNTLALIASENYASLAVRQAQGSILTNKYSEGYPGKRYYHGNQYVDAAESLAIERAKALFGAEHANVQPHSGTQANMAAYMALLSLGDTVLAMELAQGGHLSHGAGVNFSGKLYRFVHYGVDRQSELIDHDQVERLARDEQPKLIVAGATAYPRVIDFARFRAIADSVGALLMVDMAHFAGLVAAGCHPSPVPLADVVTMTTHKTFRGPRGAMILCRKNLASKIDRTVFPGIQGGPLDHAITAKAVALKEASTPEYAQYQRQVVANARALAATLARKGLRLVSGGTDTHLMLVDLTATGMTGQEASEKCQEAGIILNKNLIPYDPRPPVQASGLRIGTPCVTTRGMGENEMAVVGKLIADALEASSSSDLERVRESVLELCRRFPAPVEPEIAAY